MSTPDRTLSEIAPAGGQKRPRDGNFDGPSSKRSHISNTEEEVQVKVLIPTSAVGAIIGKGGEAMRSLKHESGCRVQMSKNQDVYPGTAERICLVRGKIASVVTVLESFSGRIAEKVSKDCVTDQFDHKGIERSKEMKLIVPNTSAGMVIGKAGARIKEIRDATRANIQVYPKQGSQEAKVSQERIITVAGDTLPILMDACFRVLEKVAADPLHAQNSDLFSQQQQPQMDDFSVPYQNSQNYSDPFGRGGGPPPGFQGGQFGPSGPPPPGFQASYPQSQPPPSRPPVDVSYGPSPIKNEFNGSSPGYKFNPMQGLTNADVMGFLDSLQSTLRTSGFGEQAVSEIMQAMQVLAKFNIMGLGLGLGVAAMAQMRSDRTMTGGPSGGFESRPTDTPDRTDSFGRNESMGGVLIDVMSQGNQQKTQNFAASVIKERPQIDPGFLELEVPDAIVGAVLGQKAKTLQDIQQYSGAKVEVHKRSNGGPGGTRHISLSGDPDHVRAGRVMIEQVINDEQSRRLQQQQRTFM